MQIDETVNLGWWAQDTYSFCDDWKGVIGTRVDHTRYRLRDKFTGNGNQSGATEYTNASPRIGFIYEASPKIQVYGNFSVAVEPPVFSEMTLSNTSGLVDLQAQRSYVTELGTRGEWDRFDWDFSTYDAEIDGELFQNTNGGTGQSVLTNIPCTRHLGIELGLGVKLVEGLLEDGPGGKRDYIRLATAYTWSDFTIVEDGSYTNNRLPGIPEHHLVAELEYRHPVGFYYAFRTERACEYYVDKANGLVADGFTVFGMRSGMEFGCGLELFAEIRNLTDVTYASAVSTLERGTSASAQFKPADGFAVYGGFEWSY
jgi:iron complex outermembrane receptor protein